MTYSIKMKVHIDGVPMFPYTNASGDARIERMDEEALVLRTDAVTYDLPIYSKLFVMREAMVVVANPYNNY